MSLPDLSVKVQKETLNLSDGTTLLLAKTPGQSDDEWKETKVYLENNPEEARRWDNYSKDAGAIRAHIQATTFQDYYQTKLSHGDEHVFGKLKALEHNADFSYIFDDIKKGGMQSAMAYYYNEPLMMKLSRAAGGVPEETRTYLEQVQKTPLTFQEACKMGDLKAAQDYINANGTESINDKDAKGITALAYAVGANRAAVVKYLLEQKASPSNVDNNGCSCLHYAAAYGRKELVEYFLSAGADINLKNTQGQTPLALATKNKQAAVADFLKSKGASA
mmetsp:Transcript_21246/g.31817  ORF Transcript_21246/g.31817 Transcript_21246/m.31817 type:complete len:277 (-) Transcript_21246:42-872(-)|eukprot:CAMPEP_0206481186 /NCGR_PEP_ID=MMETSP0324_2-20121206/37975_1 /ASSEMBLY_ACC=CAM_ASM_000836 /TAXON_ID=2866 /ORGANISM="Crypthecodinium cohnii, Strain Seligo" /LENGTH=276 /DNA_ID=CAMNT_0053958587 /DNA_START=59 /DNA_END=889 /DNA_ORIENTATION=-